MLAEFAVGQEKAINEKALGQSVAATEGLSSQPSLTSAQYQTTGKVTPSLLAAGAAVPSTSGSIPVNNSKVTVHE